MKAKRFVLLAGAGQTAPKEKTQIIKKSRVDGSAFQSTERAIMRVPQHIDLSHFNMGS